MINLNITEVNAVKKPAGFDVSDYFSQIFSMYDGAECQVKLQCENFLMKYVVDRFGEKVQTTPIDEKHFTTSVTVSLSPTFYGWVFSFGGKMLIASPAEAKDGFYRLLKQFK